MTESETKKGRKRLSGGFWRRALAALIDWIVVGALVSTVGVVAYRQTGGVVRLQQAVLMSTNCNPTKTIPAGLGLPPNFRIDSAVLCTSTLVGHEVNRFVKVTQTDQAGMTFTTQWRAGAVDVQGRILPRAIFVDSLSGALLLVGLTLLEGTIGVSPGKAVMGLRVVGDRSGKPTLRGSLVRNLVLYGAWATSGVVTVVGALGGPNPNLGSVGTTMSITLSLLMVAPFVAMAFQRPDPFYDLWAGVRVGRR
jgi:uncharacterized RDD family membrane protein YckC